MSILSKIESIKPFSEPEAWALFRICALAEALGWTLLICGIAINHFRLPGQHLAIPIAGQLHGTIFLTYFAILAAVYSSTGWSRKKFLLAIAAGIPPYGTLVFERWASFVRSQSISRRYVCSIVLIRLQQVRK